MSRSRSGSGAEVSVIHLIKGDRTLGQLQSLYDFFAEIQNYSIFFWLCCQFFQGH